MDTQQCVPSAVSSCSYLTPVRTLLSLFFSIIVSPLLFFVVVMNSTLCTSPSVLYARTISSQSPYYAKGVLTAAFYHPFNTHSDLFFFFISPGDCGYIRNDPLLFQYLPYNRITMLRLSFTCRYTIDDPFRFHDMNFVYVSTSE